MPAESQLTYQDVRRAAQEATNSLQTALGDLQNILRAIKTDTSIINDVHAKATITERSTYSLQQLQQRFDTHTQLVQDMITAVQDLHQTTTNLQQRVVNIEQLASTMSTFLNDVHEYVTSVQAKK